MLDELIDILSKQLPAKLKEVSLPPFAIPHLTVPACLSGLAFWGANQNFDHSVELSSGSYLLIGTIAGSLFGLTSAKTFFNNRTSLKLKIHKNLAALQSIITDEETPLTNEQHRYLIKTLSAALDSEQLSGYSHFQTVFGVFTTLVTTFAYTSVWSDFLDKNAAMFIFSAIFAPLLATLEIYIANKGQLQEKQLRAIYGATLKIQTYLDGCSYQSSEVA